MRQLGTSPPVHANLLTDSLIHAAPRGMLTLPGVLSALSCDEVDTFPALRPHQAPTWHMFLVQLAGLALHRSKIDRIPQDEADWIKLLRDLTAEFDADEPWCLVVSDSSMPAFLQPPVPENVSWKSTLASADALDLLVTAKNHDLKRAVAWNSRPEDWIFALVSLQTGAGYGGRGHHGNSENERWVFLTCHGHYRTAPERGRQGDDAASWSTLRA